MKIPTPHSEWRESFGVIDVHTHLAIDRLPDAIRLMEQNGLEMLIDISARFGEDFTAFLQAASAYPGRFAAFTGLDFRDFGEPGWAKRECDHLERAVEQGAVGFKIHKSLGLERRDSAGRLIPVDDERLAPLFEKAAELNCVVAMHIADPKAFFIPLNEKNERWDELKHNPHWWFGDRTQHPYDWWRLIRQLEKVVRRHPRTTIMGVHFGCAAEEIGYVADVMRDHPNYIVDIAARVPELGRHEPAFVREIFTEFQDRILFGTDLGIRRNIMLGSPQPFEPQDADVAKFYQAHWLYFETSLEQIAHPTPIQGNWKIDAVDLPRPVLAKLYADNARRLLLKK